MTVGRVIAFIKMLRVLVLACAPIETVASLACDVALGRSQDSPTLLASPFLSRPPRSRGQLRKLDKNEWHNKILCSGNENRQLRDVEITQRKKRGRARE